MITQDQFLDIADLMAQYSRNSKEQGKFEEMHNQAFKQHQEMVVRHGQMVQEHQALMNQGRHGEAMAKANQITAKAQQAQQKLNEANHYRQTSLNCSQSALQNYASIINVMRPNTKGLNNFNYMQRRNMR